VSDFQDEGSGNGLSACTILVAVQADLEGCTELPPLNDDVPRVEADVSGTLYGYPEDVRDFSVQTMPCPLGLWGCRSTLPLRYCRV
jgi:hypothetical protein